MGKATNEKEKKVKIKYEGRNNTFKIKTKIRKEFLKESMREYIGKKR